MRALFIAALFTLAFTFPPTRAAGQSAASTAKGASPVDFTGYWVAYVSEDWRFRMVTPRTGDYRNVPMTEQALKVA